MPSNRISAHISGPLAAFVEKMVGPAGLYETPSEYIRDLIRRDMAQRAGRSESEAILAGYQDLAASRTFVSTGNFHEDMKILTRKDATGW